jgi:hypothetical protein
MWRSWSVIGHRHNNCSYSSMILFSTAIKIGADTFLYKVYRNGFKAMVKVAEEAIENLPVLYCPKSIEADFLQQFNNDLGGVISISKNETANISSVKKFWSKLLNTVSTAQA